MCWLTIIPRVIQESVETKASAQSFDQAKPTAEQGTVFHSPDEAGSKNCDAGAGSSRLLNYERYKQDM